MADEQKKIREVASEEVKKEEMAIDNGDWSMLIDQWSYMMME
jgi:hypothetical protein